MRYLIAILLVLTIVTPAWATQDDSGLKTFRIDAKDMLGVVDEFPTEDTKSAAQYDNFLYAPSGLYTVPNTITLTDGTVGSGVQLPTGRTWTSMTETGVGGAYAAAIYNGSTEVYYVTSSNYYLMTVETNVVEPQIFLSVNAYIGSAYTYLLLGGGLYRGTVNGTALDTKITTPWTKAVAGCMWQSHMFVAERYAIGSNSFQNRLWWSSAASVEDWTVAVNRGGYIDFPLNEEIISIQGTLQGLLVLTNTGAYVVSGPTPENWQTDKIFSNRNDLIGSQAIGFNFEVPLKDSRMIFLDKAANFNIISDLQLNKIGMIPGIKTGGVIATNTIVSIWSAAQWDNRYIVIPLSSMASGPIYANLGYALVFDLETKSWYKWTEVAAVSDAFMISSSGIMYVRPTIRPVLEAGKWTSNAVYKSAVQTLDQNAQTCKDVVRIEVDCKAKSGSTFEVALISNTATVTKTFTSTSDNLASYEFYPKIGSACRSYSFRVKATSGFVLKSIRAFYIDRGNLKTSGGN